MKSTNITFLAVLICLFAFQGCEKNQEVLTESSEIASFRSGGGSHVIVCNRVAGTVSVIDANSGSLITDVIMPDGGEPMYVVHIPQTNAYWVGDRLNNRVVAFDDVSNAFIGSVPAGDGVFHMWAANTGRFLFVVNDVENTVSVIKPGAMKNIINVPIPADLDTLGGKPHDVIASTNEEAFFVTVVGLAGVNDYVVKYSLATMGEVARAAVGKDAHVTLNNTNNNLYVACQNPVAGVYTLNRNDLTQTDFDAFDGAHGVGISNFGNTLYVTDLPGAGIGTFDLASGSFTVAEVTTPFPTAHNLTHTSNDKLYCTHSGATADQVTIYDVSSGAPVYESVLNTGLNPFGITSFDL